MGAIYGPFDKPPFTPWMAVSPLMTRPKPDSDERRVIVDLSYPHGGINKYIRPHEFDGLPAVHNLPTVELAVQELSCMCPGHVHLAVIDLSRAYRQFPVPPTDWPLLGLFFEGKYYCDSRIPFGAHMSSFAMQSVADFIVRALAAEGMKAFMYLDDILLMAGSGNQAVRQYDQTVAMLKTMGLQVASKKLQPPSRKVTWLGIQFERDSNIISIPADKLDAIKKCLAATARQSRITVRHMQSIIGYANHLAKVVRAARIFIGRLLAALRAAESDYIEVSNHIRADLGWFSRYVDRENARAIIPHNRTVLRIWADSCLQGGGATDGDNYYSFAYPPDMTRKHHITQLEALNVLAAVRVFVKGSHAAGIIDIMCDNRASISAFSSGRARDPVLAACCRAMWFRAAETQTQLRFSHVPGESMVLPDALSRAHFMPSKAKLANKLVRDMHLRRARVDKRLFTYADFI